ncbi:MAG: L-2-amino-thiazoline-4-carboxylic acid hydrolase [Candidatus Hermodarchaeota archaeon]
MKHKENVEENLRKKLSDRIHAIRENRKNPAQLNNLLIEWEKDFGSKYNELAKKIIAEQTHKAWAELATSRNASSIDDLVHFLWENWTEGDFTIEKTEEGIQIYCTKCPIATTYQSIGKQEYGLLFHCSEDPHIVAGFNPDIKFRRTKTLMNGDECCDHHYSTN